MNPRIEKNISNHMEEGRSIFTLCFSPDQKEMCSAGSDTRVIFTNLQNHNTEKIFTGHDKPILGSDFSSKGNFLVTASLDRTARIWNVESENGNSIKLEGHSGIVICARYFHKDPKKVISCSNDRTIKIWNIERKKEISTLKGSKGPVLCVDILPDNQTIVSGDSNGKLRIWDFRSGKCVKIIDHHKVAVLSVQFHPNTFSLASGGYDKTIKIFDFRTFQLLQNYEEHVDLVRSVCFHPSGKFLLSGSDDNTVKLFDLSQKKVLYTLNDHSHYVYCVKFSPDGKSFASGSADKKLLLWNFPLGKMFCDDKDIAEEERVKYLIQKDLHSVNDDDVDCCGRNILKIRIDDFQNIFCYKFFFL